MAQLVLPNEHLLTLKDGRTLAWTQCGADAKISRRVLVFLHGVFGVGDSTPQSGTFCKARGFVGLAPTLPGWGRSSPFPAGAPLSAYAADIQELIHHVLGGEAPTHVVAFGGSYGSIWAYSVAANSPPQIATRIEPASAVCGLIAMGAFSPFREHKEHTVDMSWMNWFSVSAASRSWFLRWIHPLFGKVISSKIAGNLQGSLDVLRSILTGPKAMTAEEKQTVTAWAEGFGLTFEDWERNMARNMSLSTLHTVEGFKGVPDMLNSDWGFQLAHIDVGQSKDGAELPAIHKVPAVLPRVVVVGAKNDHLSPLVLQRYVAAHIPGAQLIELEGNHISAIVSLWDIIGGVVSGLPLDS